MIGQITELWFNKWKQVVIHGEEITSNKNNERHIIDIAFANQELTQLMETLKLKWESDLVGMNIAFTHGKNVEVYILLDLNAKYYKFGPSAKSQNCRDEIVGECRDLEDGRLFIETSDDDKYVECCMNPAILWWQYSRMHEIFGEHKIDGRVAFYSHKTGKGYIGYRIDAYTSIQIETSEM